MQRIIFKPLLLLFAGLLIFTTACKKKNDDPQPTPTLPVVVTKAFRKPMDYNTLTATTSYRTAFLDEAGDSTVDRNEGRNRLRMFRALATYISSSITAGTAIDETKLNNMYANTNSPFEGVYADLNALTINIKEATGSSTLSQSSVHTHMTDAFAKMALISTKSTQTAIKGTAGKSGTYLLDENGIETAQVIQKSLIGAYHLDYICNVLLNTGLDADNKGLVSGKKYTALEHNWDLAYGLLTMNDIYGSKEVQADPNATPAVRASSGELYLGAYAWEYNKTGYKQLHAAFLKGRAAIVNNDMNEVKAQASIIKNIFEVAIGGAANGYMKKAADGSATETSRAHAFGEGYGFAYSTRFCKQLNSDGDNYSNLLINSLINDTTPTFYDITVSQYTNASTSLKAKFNL